MSKCDLKTQNEAWNDGMKALKESLMLTGNATKSIKYAISEVQRKHPNVDFDIDSFVVPVVDFLKKNEFVEKNYKFSKSSEKKKKDKQDKIGALAKSIAERQFKQKGTSKQTEQLTDEEKEIKSFISSKYGKNLSKEEINELLDKEVDGDSVADFIESQIQEEKDRKEIEAKKKEAIRESEKEREKGEKRLYQEETAEQKQREKARKDYEKEQQKKAEKEAAELKKAAEKFEKKVQKAVEKFSELSDGQKVEMARKMVMKFEEDGMLDRDEIINIYSEVTGLPSMSNNFRKAIEEVSNRKAEYEALLDERDALEKAYEEEQKNYPNGVPQSVQNNYRTQLNNLVARMNIANANMAKATTKASSYLRENKYFIHDLADMMTMNIMGIESLERNLLSGVFDTTLRQPGNAASFVFSKMASTIFGIKNPIPLGARLYGGSKFKNTLSKVKTAFKTGTTEFTPDIGKFDYINAFNEFEQLKNKQGIDAVTTALKGYLKLPPMAVSRILNSTDAMFFDPVMMGELSRIAQEKGLKGVAIDMFMFNPDPKSYQEAKERAETVTYKNKNAFLNGVNNLIKFDSKRAADRLVFEKGWNPVAANLFYGTLKMGTNIVFPFISTPANIFARTVEYVIPEISVARGIGALSNKKLTKEEKIRKFSDNMGRATVGYALRYVAIQMLALGAISAGYDDEEKEVSDAIEKKAGGPNRVNIDALMRILFLQDGTEQEGDKYVNLNGLGLLGTTLGSYAHALNGLTKDQLQQLKDSNVFFMPKETKTVAFSSVTSVLDNTFMSGVNQLMRTLREPDSKNIDRYTISALNMVLSSVYPAALQKISESSEAERKKIFDKDKSWSENFYRSAGYHFLFDSGELNDKYFAIAKDEGGVTKKRDYMLFDNWLGRAIAASTSPFDSKEINKGDVLSKILSKAKEVEKKDRDMFFPKPVDKKINFTESGRRRKRDKVYEVELNDEQFDYYQKTASVMRAAKVSAYVNSEDFEKDNVEVVKKTLSKGYELSRKDAIKAVVKKYPELADIKNIKPKDESNESKERIKKYIK